MLRNSSTDVKYKTNEHEANKQNLLKRKTNLTFLSFAYLEQLYSDETSFREVWFNAVGFADCRRYCWLKFRL